MSKERTAGPGRRWSRAIRIGWESFPGVQDISDVIALLDVVSQVKMREFYRTCHRSEASWSCGP